MENGKELYEKNVLGQCLGGGFPPETCINIKVIKEIYDCGLNENRDVMMNVVLCTVE